MIYMDASGTFIGKKRTLILGLSLGKEHINLRLIITTVNPLKFSGRTIRLVNSQPPNSPGSIVHQIKIW